MDRRRIGWLIVPLAIAFLGCEPEGGREEMGCPRALSIQQGAQLQGLQPQGIQAQGFSPQGIQLAGLAIGGVEERDDGIERPAWKGRIAGGGIVWLAGSDAAQLQDRSLLEPERLAAVGLKGTALVVRTSRGRTLEGAELIGGRIPAVEVAGSEIFMTIVAAEKSDDSRLLYYRLEIDGQNVCGAQGRGLFVAGVWDDQGRRSDRRTVGGKTIGLTFSCTTGVIAKCVVWGYRPWEVGAELHEACTRMARADYCGDGVPHTREGTLIDMFDARGIQVREPRPGLTFEAAWGPEGAVCVRQPRYIEVNDAGQEQYPSCWASKPRCESWQAAMAAGAVLGNESAHARIATCGRSWP
jgi:hypothetical protein